MLNSADNYLPTSVCSSVEFVPMLMGQEMLQDVWFVSSFCFCSHIVHPITQNTTNNLLWIAIHFADIYVQIVSNFEMSFVSFEWKQFLLTLEFEYSLLTQIMVSVGQVIICRCH